MEVMEDKDLILLLDKYLVAKENAKMKDTYSKKIKEQFGSAGTYFKGEYFVEITEQAKRDSIDLDLLKEKYPEIYKEVVTKSKDKSLVLKNVKKVEVIEEDNRFFQD